MLGVTEGDDPVLQKGLVQTTTDQDNQDTLNEDSDDEEQPILSVRKKKAKRAVLDDSDDESSTDHILKETNVVKEQSQNMESSPETESDDENMPAVSKMKKIRTMEDSDDESTNQSLKTNGTASVASQNTAGSESDQDSEDDEQFSGSRNKKKTRTIEDSDDESSNQSIKTNGTTSVASQNTAGSDSDQDMENDEQLSGSRKKVVKRTVLEDSDNDDNSDDDKQGNCEREVSQKKIFSGGNDIYDAEMGSSNDESSGDSNTDGEDQAEDGDGDETLRSNMSASLKKRLAAGASKSTRKSKRSSVQRPRKEDLTELHSESQRLVRESEVRLPYHQPQKMSLADVLARAKQKQQQYSSPAAGPLWKNSPALAAITRSNDRKIHSAQSQKLDTKIHSAQSQKLDTKIHSAQSQKLDTKIHSALSQKLDTKIHSAQSQKLDTGKLTSSVKPHLSESQTASPLGTVAGDDELPDLVGPSNRRVPCSTQSENSQVNSDDVRTNLDSEMAAASSATVDDAVDDSCDLPDLETPSGLQCNPLSSQNAINDKQAGLEVAELVSDSSKKSTADDCTMQSDRNPPDCIALDIDGKETAGTNCNGTEDRPAKESGYSTESVQQSQSNGTESILESQETATPNPGKSLLTPKLGNLSMNVFTPKLSGTPDCVIDLDDEDSTPKPSGVSQLMQRLFKHSKSVPRKAKDVEVDTVVKEKCENDTEELKLEKIVYHVEGEEPVDPKMQKPGAKLTNLKQKLKAVMKVKREEARQKRCHVFELDNEEGFEEEEGELTDQTDTDEEELEEEEEEEEEMEEELDGEEYTAEEKDMKQDNPFLDDEADDDDDDAMEGELHLELDTPDADQQNDESIQVARKDFLNAALKKTQTLGMFDEDANTESPTLSQKSGADNIEISERPFEQISVHGSFKDVSNTAEREAVDDEHKMHTSSEELGKISKEESRRSEMESKDETNTSVVSLFKDKDSSMNNSSADTSFDLLSLIPAGQSMKRGTPGRDKESTDLHTPASMTSNPGGSLNKSSSRLSMLSLPIEDSQDLLKYSPQGSLVGSTPKMQSQNFNFRLDDDDTQSQMLDADGLLKIKSTGKKQPMRRQLLLDTTSRSNTPDHMDELLGLCSGQFTAETGAVSQANKASKKLFSALNDFDSNSQTTNEELLGLCSGQFTGLKSQSEQNPTQDKAKSAPTRIVDDFSTQGNMDELLGLCSGQFTEMKNVEQDDDTTDVPDSPVKARKVKRKRAVIDEDDSNESFEVADGAAEPEVDNDDEHMDSDEENEGSEMYLDEEFEGLEDELSEKKSKFSSFTVGKKHGKIRQEFVDEEAELSGSEYESDENYDLDEKDDLLDAESGDEEQMDEDELRDQVGRAHLKNLLDEDKQKLRLYQEMYLADGDLHSDGRGRMRRFRWRNADDDDTQQDLFHDSDAEDREDEELEAEHKWRTARYEREKFLEEQKEQDNVPQDEDSQLIKLGKVVFRQKPEPRLKEKENTDHVEDKITKPTTMFKQNNKGHGSFLKKSKDALAKIAEMTRPVTNVNGPRNSKNFVFSAISPDEKTKQVENDERKPQVKRCSSLPKPPSKRPRLEKRGSMLPPSSIFNLL